MLDPNFTPRERWPLPSTQRMSQNRFVGPWLFWLAIGGTLLVGLILTATSFSWHQSVAAALRADPFWLVIALLFNLANAPLWALCWRCLVQAKGDVSIRSLTQILSVALAATQVFSSIGGGTIAFMLMTRRLGFSSPATVSLLVLDQWAVGIVKVILVGAALTIAPGTPVLRSVGTCLLAGVAASLVALILLSRSRGQLHRFAERQQGRWRLWLEKAGDWSAHLEAVRSPARLGGAVFFMLLRRLSEGLGAWCVAIACGIPAGPELLVLVTASIAIVTLIPSPPGNIGLFELAVVAAYQWLGIAPEIALAAALIQHALFLVGTTAPGALMVALNPSFLKKPGSSLDWPSC